MRGPSSFPVWPCGYCGRCTVGRSPTDSGAEVARAISRRKQLPSSSRRTAIGRPPQTPSNNSTVPGYLHKIRKVQIARALARNRADIRRELMQRAGNRCPSIERASARNPRARGPHQVWSPVDPRSSGGRDGVRRPTSPEQYVRAIGDPIQSRPTPARSPDRLRPPRRPSASIDPSHHAAAACSIRVSAERSIRDTCICE